MGLYAQKRLQGDLARPSVLCICTISDKCFSNLFLKYLVNVIPLLLQAIGFSN